MLIIKDLAAQQWRALLFFLSFFDLYVSWQKLPKIFFLAVKFSFMTF